MLKYFCLISCMLFSFIAIAQNNIVIEEEPGIRQLMDVRKELNFREDRFIKAWSIQLLVTRDKYYVNEKKQEFARFYSDYKVDWEYEQPYYRLNVGAYYTKLEAAAMRHRLQEKYPDAYIFKNSKARSSDF